MRRWTWMIGFVLFFIPCFAQAQYPDILDLQIQYLPNSTLTEPQSAKVQLTTYEVGLNIPIPLYKLTTFLIPGVAYRVDSTSFEGAPKSFQELRGLHSLDFSLLFVQIFKKKWSMSIRVAPGLAGDFASIDAGLFRMSGVGMVTYSFSDRFVLGGGVLANYSFGQFLPLPAVYVDWKPIPQFQLEGFIPAFLNIKYIPVKRVELGVRVEFGGNSYGVRGPAIHQSWPCSTDVPEQGASQGERTAKPSACFDNLTYSTGSVGLTFAVRLFSSLWLNSYAGYTFFRRFEPFNAKGEPLSEADLLPNQFLIRAGITWKIPGQ